MKNLILLLTILSSTVSIGQIQQDHVYNFRFLKRVNLENRGERFLSRNLSQNGYVVEIYNSDHSLEKSINLPDTSIAGFPIIEKLSQKTFNSDDLLELPYVLKDKSTQKSTAYIINENGDVLFEQEDTDWLHISKVKGLPDRLITYQTLNNITVKNFHDPMSFQILHTFSDDDKVRFIRNGEEIFIDLSDNNLTLDLYQTNGNLLKTVAIPISTLNQNQVYLESIFNDELVANSKLEFLFELPTQNHSKIYQIIDEDGNVLFNEELDLLYFDQQANMDAKLIGTKNGNTYVYNKNFTLEHTFPFNVMRVYLEGHGEKYYRLPNQTTSIDIYNSDFTLWKSIPFQPNNSSLNAIPSITSKKINSNSDLEIFITAYDTINHINTLYLIDDLGNLLHTFPNYYTCELSEIEGLPIKIIAEGFNSSNTFKGVFSLQNAPLSIAEEKLNENVNVQSAYPNPFESKTTINLLNSDSNPSIEVYSLTGSLVYPKQTRLNHSIELNFDDCAKGIYVIKLKEGDSVSVLKIVKGS